MEIDTEVPDNCGMRVTTATPEQTQERSWERASAVKAKVLNQFARMGMYLGVSVRVAETSPQKCGELAVALTLMTNCSG